MEKVIIETQNTLKELRTGAKLMGLFIAVICFLIDYLLGFKQNIILDIIRVL